MIAIQPVLTGLLSPAVRKCGGRPDLDAEQGAVLTVFALHPAVVAVVASSADPESHEGVLMLRACLVVGGLLAAGLAADAHFVFVVPAAGDPSKVVVVFSEDLEVDENVPADRLKGLKLTGRFEGGKEAPVELKPGKSCLAGEVGLAGPRCVHGTLVFGVTQKGKDRPFLLAYHPKAVYPGADPKAVALGDKVAAELVPVVAGREVRFRLLGGGKPVAGADVTVLRPDGGKGKAKTDADGLTPAYPAAGRYGAWARHVIPGAGEHDGKKYEEARHYATLVVDLPE
ncbi:MAG: DUF4198 domain-containing protein [Gemmataceae bacterium]|nr:DUF4198 domain-containing protein [Gemmataceae bacterium]